MFYNSSWTEPSHTDQAYKVLQVFQTEGKKKKQKKTKKQRTDCKSVWFDIASEIIKKPIF